MPEILLCLLLGFIVGFCKQLRRARVNKPRPLCLDCAHAHTQYAPNGRCAIACTFAGSVRPVRLNVMYCTDYRDRNSPPRLVSIGFVPSLAAMEPEADEVPVGH
jgi:hypothetical protein